MECSLPHLGQGGRDNAPLLKYLHVQKWRLYFDEKYLSFSLTFSKCQVPIRGEYADGRIWICFLWLCYFLFHQTFLKQSYNFPGILDNYTLDSLLSNQASAVPLRPHLSRPLVASRLPNSMVSIAVILLFIPLAFNTPIFLGHFFLLALVFAFLVFHIFTGSYFIISFSTSLPLFFAILCSRLGISHLCVDPWLLLVGKGT